MELIAIFTGSFIVALSGALMPGPLLTYAVADSARRGFITGPLVIGGHAILELALVVAVVAGAGPFLRMPTVIGIISLLGGGMLLWMGVGMLRSAAGMTLNMESSGESVLGNPVIAGIIASLANPYWIIWWATLGLAYLAVAMKLGVVGIGVFFVGHISADLAYYSLVTFSISRGRKFMRDSTYRFILRACGALLVFFGCFFFATSFRHLAS